MAAKSKVSRRAKSSRETVDLGSNTTIRGLEKLLQKEAASAGSDVRIEYVGGKKISKNLKLKNIWEGFADWPKSKKSNRKK
jgi:hypothetical protein